MFEGQISIEKRRKFEKNIPLEKPKLLKQTLQEYFKNIEFIEEQTKVLRTENEAI